MADTAPSKSIVVVGILTVCIGLIPLLVMTGFLPRGTSTGDPAPDWLGCLFGAVFVGAGLMVIMRGTFGSADETSGALPANAPRWLRGANDLLAVAIVCGMAVMFSWVAFGPGPRHFSIGFDGLWASANGAGDTAGRVAFGFFSILLWCVTAFFAVLTARRWRS